MKTYTEYLNESQNFLRRVNKTGLVREYKYHPKTAEELQEIVDKEIKAQGDVDVDLNMIDTSAITNMWHLFRGNKSLEILDVSSWDVSNVKDMYGMFRECESLTSVGDLSGWNVEKVKDMSSMFAYCENLESVGDLSGWVVSSAVDMDSMFAHCKKLTSVGDLSRWDICNVKNMSYMFKDCPAPKPDWYKE